MYLFLGTPFDPVINKNTAFFKGKSDSQFKLIHKSKN